MAEDLMAKDGCIDYNMSRDEGGTKRDGIEEFQSIVFSSINKAPNDTSYFSQYLVVKPIQSC